MKPGEKTNQAMEDIEGLAQTVASLPEDEARQVIEDIEGDHE